MAKELTPATESEQHAKTHRYLEGITEELFELRRQQAELQRELGRPSLERGQREMGKVQTSGRTGVAQTRTFFANIPVEVPEPVGTPGPANARSPVPAVSAITTGVLAVAVLLLPSGSYWLMGAAAVLWVAALVSGALAIRYDRKSIRRGV